MFWIYGFSLQALGPVSFGLQHHSLWGGGDVEEAACYHCVRDEAKK